MEPVTGIEPAPPAWEAGVLPLNYTGGKYTLSYNDEQLYQVT